MKTQFDHKYRVVGLNNLEAMCERLSGMAHRFQINKVTANRAYVQYSNPDEYGTEKPIIAVLPAWPDYDNTAVVLHPVKFTGGRDEYDYQAFEQLWDCEQLFRSFDGGREVWKTEYEILAPKYPAWQVTSKWDEHGCMQTWVCNGSEFKSPTEATAWALKAMREFEQAANS